MDLQNDTVTKHVLISGRVQGVNYRYSLFQQALKYPITGWCRNLNDGRVEAILHGQSDHVETVIAWCYEGPPHARVDRVHVNDISPETPYTNFEVRQL